MPNTADDLGEAEPGRTAGDPTHRVRYLIDGIASFVDSDEDEVEVTHDNTRVGDPETDRPREALHNPGRG